MAFKILVIDDEQDILEVIVDTVQLSISSCEVQGEISAIKSLDIIDSSFNLIITDLKMPEMNGIELIKKLRDKGISIPTIVFSGHGDLEEKKEIESLGNTTLVKKPLFNELLKTIELYI